MLFHLEQMYHITVSYTHLDVYKRQAYGGVAQLGEHLLCKQGVRSSILLISCLLYTSKSLCGWADFSLNVIFTKARAIFALPAETQDVSKHCLKAVSYTHLPDNALAIERGRETIKEGYAEKKLKARTEKFEAIHGKSEEK